jgi:hypothetical protein
MSEVVECALQSNIHNKIETLPDVSSNFFIIEFEKINANMNRNIKEI